MNDRTFLSSLEEYGFLPEACKSLSRDMDRLRENAACAAILDEYIRAYAANERFSFYEGADRLAEAGKAANVHPYASHTLFYLALSPQLRAYYAGFGELSDELFYGAMADLSCKANECFAVYGIWGSFVSPWFARFFNHTLYTLGRLEFCLTPCPYDCAEDGVELKKGDLCIDVHIPSRGPLTRALLDDAYQKAADFFCGRLEGLPTVFHCESWLLADFHDEMLPPDSGILLFAHDYRFRRKAPDEGDLWRIFGHEDTDKPNGLSEDTALRRAYKARLIAGLPVYGGEGLFFYGGGRSSKNANPKGQKS